MRRPALRAVLLAACALTATAAAPAAASGARSATAPDPDFWCWRIEEVARGVVARDCEPVPFGELRDFTVEGPLHAFSCERGHVVERTAVRGEDCEEDD